MHGTEDSFHTATRRLNLQVSLLLKISTAVCLLLLIAGLALIPPYTDGPRPEITAFSSLPQELAELDPAALITLALYIILAMPALVVIISFAHFISRSERKPVVICMMLLLLLAISFLFILK